MSPEYYTSSGYDRGHLTKRHAVAWEDTKEKADLASRDSCFFSNIALQDHGFHHDEWGTIENAITATRHGLDDRFNIITGTVFTPKDNNPMLFFDDRLRAGEDSDLLNRPQLENITSGKGFFFFQ